MTERIRVDFLEWRPDLDDFQNPGMTTADNVIHDIEGYKQIKLASSGAFATTGALTTVTSIQAKPIGTNGQHLCAWLNDNTIHIGIDGVTAVSSPATTVSFATTPANLEISAFQVAELADKIFFVVEALAANVSPSTTVSLRLAGYLTYT